MNWRKLTRRRGFVGPLKKKANTIPSMSHILVTFLGRFQSARDIFFPRCTSLRNDGTHFLASVRARVDVDRSFIGPMGDAPPSDSPSTGDGADSRPRGDPPRDAVFATTGISPHEVPTTVPNASPLDSNDDADERATLEAHALELGSQLRATGGHLDALSAMSAESLAEILGMRGGVEAELDALRRERRRLETLAELESLKRSLAAVAEGREDQNIDPDETRARVAALVASLASLDDDDDGDAAASGLADAMRGLRTTLDGDEGDAVTSDDPSETLEDDDDDLDAAIAEMEARLVEARRTRDEMDAIRRALESGGGLLRRDSRRGRRRRDGWDGGGGGAGVVARGVGRR